jgi:hypothetical protein
MASLATAGTIFSVSGPTVSAQVATNTSLAAILGIGSGTYDITNTLTSLSLAAASHTITLANLFTVGGPSLANYDFAVVVNGGVITGWQFGGFDGSGLVFNALENGYDGNTVAISTSFGTGPNQFGNGMVDNVFVGTGCTALGTVSASCSNITQPGSNVSSFSELKITTTPEPRSLLLLGAVLSLLATRRAFGCLSIIKDTGGQPPATKL